MAAKKPRPLDTIKTSTDRIFGPISPSSLVSDTALVVYTRDGRLAAELIDISSLSDIVRQDNDLMQRGIKLISIAEGQATHEALTSSSFEDFFLVPGVEAEPLDDPILASDTQIDVKEHKEKSAHGLNDTAGIEGLAPKEAGPISSGDKKQLKTVFLSATVPDEIGPALRAIRKSRGMAQKTVAEKMGVVPSVVTELEQGGNPTYDTILKYIRALGAEPRLGLDFPDT